MPRSFLTMAAVMLIAFSVRPALSSSSATNRLLTVPFSANRGVPMVKVMVDGQGPYTFIFDTGEEHLGSISPKLAAELHLPKVGMGGTSDPTNGKKIKGPMFRIASLSVGNFKTKNVEVFGIDVGLDGVIGLPLFQEYLCEIKPRSGQIFLRTESLPASNGGDVLDYAVPDGIPDIAMTIAAKPVRAHLDTGNPFTISLPQNLTRGLKWLTRPTIIGRASTPANTFTIYSGRLGTKLALGAYSFPEPFIIMTNTHSDHVNFGFGFFRQFQSIIFDQLNHRVRLQRQSRVVHFTENPI